MEQKNLRTVIYKNRFNWMKEQSMSAHDMEVQNLIGNLDQQTILVEAKWGVDQLQKLCGPDMAAKWDRQFEKLCAAIDANDLQSLRDLVPGTLRAYRAMEADAEGRGCVATEAVYWEVQLPESGLTARLCLNEIDMHRVAKPGVAVWSIQEVARMMEANTLVNKVKATFPGAEVTSAKPVFDPKVGDEMPEF